MQQQSSASHGHAAEEWRPVLGYEGRYEVSDQGRVRALRSRGGRYGNAPLATPIVLRPEVKPGNHGYLRVSLLGDKRFVHRLVLEAFVGPCPEGHEGGHLNGRPGDNRLANLKWVTKSENAQHRWVHGTATVGNPDWYREHPEYVPRGSAHGRAKLTEAQIPLIRAQIAAGERQQDVAKRYGVHPCTINDIVRGRRWRHVGQEAG